MWPHTLPTTTTITTTTTTTTIAHHSTPHNASPTQSPLQGGRPPLPPPPSMVTRNWSALLRQSLTGGACVLDAAAELPSSSLSPMWARAVGGCEWWAWVWWRGRGEEWWRTRAPSRRRRRRRRSQSLKLRAVGGGTMHGQPQPWRCTMRVGFDGLQLGLMIFLWTIRASWQLLDKGKYTVLCLFLPFPSLTPIHILKKNTSAPSVLPPHVHYIKP